MNVLSLFSGVGGFDLGLEAAGHHTVFQCEWDKHATRILERHWPDVPRWGDISTLTAAHILTHAPTIDIVAWGSPCQDLSVAGKRAGLDGARSGLFHQGIRIIRELREATNGKYPRISVWENVYGALNSNRGADFGIILDEMAAAGALVQEWRVLDAQYFGVPQRRRRVFLVSIFDPATADRCPDPLLPVREGVRWHPSTSHQTRQTAASTTATGFGNGGFNRWSDTDTAITLSARDHKGGNTVITEGFTGTSHAQYGQGVGTLRANGGDLGGGSETLLVEPTVFTKGKRAQTDTDDETWDENRPAPTLNAFDHGDSRSTTIIAEPVFFQMHQSGETRIQTDVMHTLAGYMGTGGNNTPMVAEPIAFSHTQGLDAQPSADHWPTLRMEGAGHAVMESTMSVRRLTPLECERLMGWPDDWTAGQADSHRYKQCGNGVASPVAEWIGQQLTQLDH